MTVVHFLIILIVPFLTPVISFLAISTMTYLQEDIYAHPVYFFDFYMANRLDPWWKNIPHLDIFLYVQIIVLVYIVVALVELVSFYLTG